MLITRLAESREELWQVLRFGANGVFATIVHFLILVLCIEYFQVASAGFANLLAACVGVATSFVGNRYFVFRRADAAIVQQFSKFLVLYAATAVMHGTVLFVWTDLLLLDYRFGFIVATGFQVLMTYVGNKLLVFK